LDHDSIDGGRIEMLKLQEQSEWRCYLFGSRPDHQGGMVWHPLRGHEPNWFWRKMQYLILGNTWVYRPKQ
jgi:hypothetical protein